MNRPDKEPTLDTTTNPEAEKQAHPEPKKLKVVVRTAVRAGYVRRTMN